MNYDQQPYRGAKTPVSPDPHLPYEQATNMEVQDRL